MRTPKKQTEQEKLQQEALQEVLRFRQYADPLKSIDLLTYQMVETMKREGCYDSEEWDNFYGVIRLLTVVATVDKTLQG